MTEGAKLEDQVREIIHAAVFPTMGYYYGVTEEVLISRIATALCSEYAREQVEAIPWLMGHRACPCVHTTPCDPMCTCVNQFSSRGCARCCTYGSKEQQRAAAEHLVSLEARERALREALSEYGQHKPACSLQMRRGFTCACGLDAAVLAPRRG